METAKFDRKQVLTLLGFAAYVVMTLVLGWDIMVAPAVFSLVLLVLNAADSKKVIADIPWGILIMISGMSVLASVVVDLGGVDLLSGVFSKVSVSSLAAPLMGLIGGAMSFFSSGNGVVIPTLVPTIPSISAATSALAPGILDENGEIRLCVREARERGVYFNLSHGSSNFSFDTSRKRRWHRASLWIQFPQISISVILPPR